MANWQTDKEYAKYVKEQGGRRSGKGYERFLEKKAREKEAEEKEKFLRSKAGQEEEIDELLEEMELYDMPDSDKIRNDLYSSIADNGDEEAYERFKDKLLDYKSAFLEFLRQKREKQKQEEQQKREKEKQEEKKRNAYKQKFSLAKGKLNAALLAKNDRNRVNDFLKSIEYSVGDENDAKLQKIALLDFHNPKTGKTKGKIIWGIILMFLGGLRGSSQPDMSKWWFIFCYALCLSGLFLFIRGIVTGKKNKKAQIEAAQYNFGLVKSIIYAKPSEETTDDDKKSGGELENV